MTRHTPIAAILLTGSAWALFGLGCTPVTSGPIVPCTATPAPGVCCEIIWGSLHGTVRDNRAQPVPGVTVTLRAKNGAPMGNCDRQVSTVTGEDGTYGFNVVPFDTPLEIVAASSGLGSQTKEATVVRGPMAFVDITF